MPVLAVVGSRDEYYDGSSCQISRNVGGSKSIVILDADHDIMGHPELKQAPKTFLRECCRQSPKLERRLRPLRFFPWASSPALPVTAYRFTIDETIS